MAGNIPSESQQQRPPGGAAERDEVYHWDTARFLIDGVVFKLPRYQFTVGSPYFAKTYLQGVTDVTSRCQTPAELVDVSQGVGDGDDDAWDSVDVTEGGLGTATGKGAKARGGGLDEGDKTGMTTTSGAIPIEGVTADQFRTFLKLLFPIYSTSPTTTLSKQEWLTVLTLSTRWHFAGLRKIAIEALHPYMSFDRPPLGFDSDTACSISSANVPDPVEMIILGRAAFVPKWVEDGYERLVTKGGEITEEECGRVGWRTGVRLYIVRHKLDQARDVTGAGRQDGCPRSLVREAFKEELGLLTMEDRTRRTAEEEEEEEKEKERRRVAEEEGERERKRVEEEEERRLKEEGERRAREEKERGIEREEEERRRKEEEEREKHQETQRLKEEEKRREGEMKEEAKRLKKKQREMEEEEAAKRKLERSRRKEEKKALRKIRGMEDHTW